MNLAQVVVAADVLEGRERPVGVAREDVLETGLGVGRPSRLEIGGAEQEPGAGVLRGARRGCPLEALESGHRGREVPPPECQAALDLPGPALHGGPGDLLDPVGELLGQQLGAPLLTELLLGEGFDAVPDEVR